MTKAVLALGLLSVVLLLAGCTDLFGGATPTAVATATPVSSATPASTATPIGTATPTPSFTPVPTITSTPSPTITPTATATEGAVRTPVGGAAGPELQDALTAMERSSSYRYAMEMEVGPATARMVLIGTGEYVAPDSYHTIYHALQFSTEEISVGALNYVRVNGGEWQAGAPPAKTYPLGPPPPVKDLLGLITYSLDAALVRDESLDGVPARHLRLILRPASLPGMQGPFNGLAGGDLWVDPASHRFLRLALIVDPASSPEQNHAAITINFAGYNTPIKISLPR